MERIPHAQRIAADLYRTPVKFAWPSYPQLLAVDATRLFNVGRQLRVAWALARSLAWRRHIAMAVARCPYIAPTFSLRPVLFRPVLSQFLDPRLTTRTRYGHFAHDIEFTASRVQAAFPGFFPSSLSGCLWSDPQQGWSVTLALNLISPQEGLWRVSLHGAGEVRVFSLCFSVLPGREMFVGAVQGGTVGAGFGAQSLIQTATRDFEGLRPPFLLFEVLRTLARAWGVQSMVGISLRHQPKTRAKRRARHEVRYAYDDYFRQLGATARSDDNWQVPISSSERSAEEIPARKRAMYRRRYQLLRSVRETVVRHLKAEQGPPTGLC